MRVKSEIICRGENGRIGVKTRLSVVGRKERFWGSNLRGENGHFEVKLR